MYRFIYAADNWTFFTYNFIHDVNLDFFIAKKVLLVMSYYGFEESFSTLLESVEIGKGVSDSVSVDELLQILHQVVFGEHL